MSSPFARCRLVPLADHQTAFLIDGLERLRWHFGPQYPRPFFFPLVGPSGSPLTRMGHPGAPNHDHHRSIWFAHHKLLGIDFWSDQTAARIRQQHWLAYEDGDDEARMAVLLGWYDGHDAAPLMEQELVAAVRPGLPGETQIELQSTLRPKAATLELGQTNFGLLAVRVAKNLSAHFGGGQLTSSDGRRGEAAIFGRQAAWMDYSGPAPADGPQAAAASMEGITYFDHPANPGYPTHWHVREDGWMGAALCMHSPLSIQRDAPLVVRYLLHAHRGHAEPQRADAVAAEFAARPACEVVKSQRKHTQYEIRRQDA